MPLPVGDEADFLERLAVDDEHAVGHHVGDVEHLAVRADAGCPAACRPFDSCQVADDLATRRRVDLRERAVRELAREDRVAAVDREVGVVDAGALAASSIEYCSAIVFGSRKSSRFIASATTIADLPSGEKYMLYGSSTAIALPGLPVSGSIGVRLPSVRALGVVRDPQRRMSHDGTTCCGLMPTLNLSITLSVAGSMT